MSSPANGDAPQRPSSPAAVAAPTGDLVDEKKDATHLEAKHIENNHAVPMPDSLLSMTSDEIKSLEKKMVRKMDMVIMPIMGILYILNYVDRSALAATKVYGIMEDLSMTTTEFSTAISILFVGYIPFQIPSNLLMTKISRPGFYICAAATLWGSVATCTGAIQTYEQLLALRVLLGVTEAVFFPGVIYFMSAWYNRNELGKRLGALFIFQMLGSAFGGLIAAGCLTLDGRYGITGWRWLFIVEGVVTVGFGLIFALIMPEYPHNARLLKPLERDYAVWRLEVEAGAGEANEDTTTMGGFRLALLDTKIWTLVWCMGMSQAMGTIVNFFPTIVQTLGFNEIETMLLTAPPYIVAAVMFYCFSWYSDRKNVIFPIIIACLSVAVVSYIISLATLNTGARYFAMMLMPTTIAGPQIMLYKTLNLHMARPYPKRAAGTAMMNAIGGLSNIWGSYLYYDEPEFTAAFACLLGCCAAFLVTISAYRFYVLRINRLLDNHDEGAASADADVAKAKKSGVTQQQVELGWRYIGY